MTIPAIGAISGIGGLGGIDTVSSLSGAGGAGAANGLGAASGLGASPDAFATSGTDFAHALGKGFDAVQSTQATADNLAVQAATGQLVDPAQYTIAATQAALMTQLATTVESKAVQAFNQIMNMQA
jgi:flagellar hook-basal body complex protein FliE